MASKVPFVKNEINWMAVIIKLSFLIVLNLLFYFIDKKAFFVEAVFVYVMISYSLRILVVPKEHRTGINLIRNEKFEEAIPYFQKCVDFFTKYAWVDKYRVITMFISSKRTFREISLCNEAFCMLQSKRVDEAKKNYEEVLTEYPENTIARSA